MTDLRSSGMSIQLLDSLMNIGIVRIKQKTEMNSIVNFQILKLYSLLEQKGDGKDIKIKVLRRNFIQKKNFILKKTDKFTPAQISKLL